MGDTTTNAFSGLLSIFTSAPWLGPALCASPNPMGAQSAVLVVFVSLGTGSGCGVEAVLH